MDPITPSRSLSSFHLPLIDFSSHLSVSNNNLISVSVGLKVWVSGQFEVLSNILYPEVFFCLFGIQSSISFCFIYFSTRLLLHQPPILPNVSQIRSTARFFTMSASSRPPLWSTSCGSRSNYSPTSARIWIHKNLFNRCQCHILLLPWEDSWSSQLPRDQSMWTQLAFWSMYIPPRHELHGVARFCLRAQLVKSP